MYYYDQLIINGFIDIDTKDIDASNINDHFFQVLDILRDGIETDLVQSMKIHVKFEDNVDLTLTVFDYWFNLIFWTIPVEVGIPIESKFFFFFENGITKGAIKSYIDNLFIRSFRTTIPFKTMNNILDDTIYKMKYINEFALYLANTINFEDTIDLMRQYPEFNESIHADLSSVPIEDVKNKGMEYANTQIEYIKGSDHCLKDSFISREAINPKQFKEVFANIGSKPNGQGGVFPYIINNSFINGGVADPRSYIIESSNGRTAQILQKMNVGTSGAFARLLEINNIDTFFNPDPNFFCTTRNYEDITIKDASWLKIYDQRYYKLDLEGPDYLLDAKKDFHLIGKTLHFRSPMTCASFAAGQGICRRCYGDLYFVIKNINAGKIAAELLSSIYTQMLLSAKHLLESAVIDSKWNEEFFQLFSIDMNFISLNEDQDYTGYDLCINPDEIQSMDEDDEIKYNEYINSINVRYPNGTIVHNHPEMNDEIYLSEDLNIKMRKFGKYVDNNIVIPFNKLKDLPVLFYIRIQNKELSRTLEKSKHIINKASETSKYNRHEILSEFITTNMEGGINLNAVHYEVILANQIRDADNILKKPNWDIPNAPYTILTLGSSLTNNPSIAVTLEYQKIGSTLVSPLSSKKRTPSYMDVFFMPQPQNYIDNTNNMVSDDYKMRDEEPERKRMVRGVIFDDPDDTITST